MIELKVLWNRANFLTTIPEHVFTDTLLLMEMMLNCCLRVLFSCFLYSIKIPRDNLRLLLVYNLQLSCNKIRHQITYLVLQNILIPLEY